MADIPHVDYSVLDRPEVLNYLFYPRQEQFRAPAQENRVDVLIPVEEDIVIGSSFHLAGKSNPNILFFHGNGEIVADYDDLAPIYLNLGINLFAADYRGYGRSSGNPSVTGMMGDCHIIFDYILNWMKENDHTGPLVVMGRSLGSASALELANYYKDRIDGLVIESGFAYLLPLLRLMGINVGALGISEEDGCRNLEKIGTYDKPTLVIHAEYDHIIPFSDGQALFDASTASEKKMIKIEGANHNDILFRGFRIYLQGIHDLMTTVS